MEWILGFAVGATFAFYLTTVFDRKPTWPRFYVSPDVGEDDGHHHCAWRKE